MSNEVADGFANLRRREAEMKAMIEDLNAGRKPQFGDEMLNPWAGEGNPTRVGVFVSEYRRTGRCNPGHFYKLTDKKGRFWDTWSHNCVFTDHLTGNEVWP